jgi:hypothetical protein
VIGIGSYLSFPAFLGRSLHFGRSLSVSAVDYFAFPSFSILLPAILLGGLQLSSVFCYDYLSLGFASDCDAGGRQAIVCACHRSSHICDLRGVLREAGGSRS